MFHTCSSFVFVISNFAWLICIRNVNLTSKRSKFNLNILMSIQGVPAQSQQGKFPKFNTHLIKMLLWLRLEHFTWFSGGLCEPAILNFFLVFALQCNIVILRSFHRYSECWSPRSQSDCRYFGIYVIKTNRDTILCHTLSVSIRTGVILLLYFNSKCPKKDV